jgi:hypothetical protein
VIGEALRTGDPVRIVGDADGEGLIIGFYRHADDDHVVVRLETGGTQVVPATHVESAAA